MFVYDSLQIWPNLLNIAYLFKGQRRMGDGMAEWTFVTNHALVLSLVTRNPQITALEMANEIGITERAVRKIIKDLEAANYLSRKRDGRRVRYTTRANLALRHRSQRDKLVGDLLRLLR